MKTSDITECVASLQDELFELARELVRRPSVTGDETEAQQFIAAYWRGLSLTVDAWTPQRADLAGHPAFCDDGLPVERPIVVGQWGEGAPALAGALILNGHIDVVPTGDPDRWRVDPFEGLIEHGLLHGRGACDMKGGLAAATIAVQAAARLGVTPKRPVLLQSVTGEETGGIGSLATILRGYRADSVVIAEPTLLSVCPVHSGAVTFRTHVPGRATHGAMREAGVSAIEKFWHIWRALYRLEAERHEDFTHPMFRGTSLAAPLCIGKLEAGNWPSTVPEEAVAEGRFGVLPGEGLEEARDDFERAVREACQDDDWLCDHPVRIEWCEGQFEPGETHPGAEVLVQIARAHLAVTGREPRAHGVPYGSDLRLFTRHGGMNAVLYGPGDVQLAHATDESIPLEQLVLAAQVFTTLICDIMGE